MLDHVVDNRKTSFGSILNGIYERHLFIHTCIQHTYTSEHKYNMCVDKTWTLLATLDNHVHWCKCLPTTTIVHSPWNVSSLLLVVIVKPMSVLKWLNFLHIHIFPLASIEFQIKTLSFVNEMKFKSLTFSIPHC
jgi:hypothetical protein